MFGIDGGEFVILALLALFLLGPERLPGLTKQAARALHDVRRWTQRTREDIGRELGPEFENFDLSDLNPKKFVQKHLLDPLEEDDEDDVKEAPSPPVYGHSSLSSITTGVDDAGTDGADDGPVSLLKPGAGSDRAVPVGPVFTTDVFAAPGGAALALAERRAPTVPSWGDTASARQTSGDGEPESSPDGLAREDDLDDESSSWESSLSGFYLPPPIDMDAT